MLKAESGVRSAKRGPSSGRGSHSLGGTYGPRTEGIVHWPTRRLVILLFITGCERGETYSSFFFFPSLSLSSPRLSFLSFFRFFFFFPSRELRASGKRNGRDSLYRPRLCVIMQFAGNKGRVENDGDFPRVAEGGKKKESKE